MAEDQFQYIKLPDGSYGKFLASASDEQIKAAISKDFPTAFKKPETAPGLGKVNFENISPEDEATIRKQLGMPAAGAQATLAPAAPEKPESLTDRILRYGKTAAGIAIPTAGGMLGGAAGLATPLPGGALAGEILGSAGGEYLNQKLGLSEPSTTDVVLAGAAPVGGRLVGAGLKALPISRAGAISKLTKFLPSETSAALFGKAGTQALDQSTLAPVTQRVLQSTQKIGKVADDALTDVFEQLTSNKQLSMKELEVVKDSLQNYSNYYSNFGNNNYNPRVADEFKAIKALLTETIESINPGYKAALKASAREKNVSRLQTFLSKTSDPAKAFKELRMTPPSDLKGKPTRLMMSGFDSAELDQIQGILERLPKGLDWKSIVGGRLAAGAVVGAIGYGAGGNKEALGAGALAMMLGAPIGRRMLSEMIKSGTINNPSAWATAAQVVRAASARLPTSGRSPEEPQE